MRTIATALIASIASAADGRIVVAWFGSQGIYAYDMSGGLRWSVDLDRVDMGAYDIPAYEWGPASSPIIWNDLVIVQWGTPTVVTTAADRNW